MVCNSSQNCTDVVFSKYEIQNKLSYDILNFSCKLVLLGAGPLAPWEEGGPL